MYKELNELLAECEIGVTKDIVGHLFNNIEAKTQEELNVKSALLKQSFFE